MQTNSFSKSLPFFVFACLASVAAHAMGQERIVEYGGRMWRLSPGCRIEGDTLIVTIPEGQYPQTQWARTDIDLAPWENRGFEAHIKARGEDIATPTQPWLGFKFMLSYRDRVTGAMRYPGAGAPTGSFDWRETSFREMGWFRGTDGPGVLHLGLQGTSGTVVFDLSSLDFGDLRPIWPVVNQDLRCQYSEEIASGAKMRRGFMSPSGRDMNQDDFDTLASWGATLLRYQMVRDWHGVGTNQDLDDFDRWLDGKLDHLERVVLPLARERGISVVVDMHVTPGGRDASHETNMFHDRRYAEHFVKCWRRIARRLRGAGGVYGYDLVNEPQQQRTAEPGMDGWSLQLAAARAIREVDAETPIVVEVNVNDASEGYRNMSPMDLPNIIYEVHVYGPSDFSHQGILGMSMAPCRWPDSSRNWDADYIRHLVEPVRAFQLRHGAKIYVGEFSAVAWADGAENWMRDAIEVFEEYGWDWTFHAFREWRGWSVEHEGPDIEHMAPSADNPRKRVLLKALSAPAP